MIGVFLLVAASSPRAAEIYVAPEGDDRAAGTPESPLASPAAAFARAAPGDVIRLLPGTYRLSETLRAARDGTEHSPIRVEPADPNTRPVFDFSAQPTDSKSRGIELPRDWWQIVGLEIVGAGDNGINITGGHNLVQQCIVRECRDSGIQLGSGANHNLVSDCDSFRNADPHNRGENADGFAAKGRIGPGNVFRNCRAWENCDDGWDLWEAPLPVRIENCLAFRNGINLWAIPNFAGDGNGFKLGGNHVPAAHVVLRCVAIDHPHRGFDQNNNAAGLTIEDCLAVRCEYGFYLPAAPRQGPGHALRRNIALDCPVKIADGSQQVQNRWMSDQSK